MSRPRKVQSSPVQTPVIKDAERALMIRYPKSGIIEGSLADSGTYPEFGAKRTVEITCVVCGKPHRIATSDLFHTSAHKDCKREAAKVARNAARVEREAANKAKRKAALKPSKKGKLAKKEGKE